MTMTAPQVLMTTRASWHRLAEHVLAAGQFAAQGTIRLRPYPGGFATTVGFGDRQLAVAGDELLVIRHDAVRSERLTTLGRAARFAGVELGLRGSYPPATSADPDAPLPVDPTAARWLADWFALGDAALRRFAEEVGEPMEPVLWPEHFDLGVVLEAVNYGCSPGDAALPEPYLYVGPHEGRPSVDPFWNAAFGAAFGAHHIVTTDDAVAFFSEGRRQVLRDRSRT
ncbi:hypothetical protein [Blastococcus deserti]|uniref:Uncharacterized protein n=1 Tax=Blastococcus deserti TaxID=2259033 RepID=A0ABW4XCM8_9ACTN